MDAAATIAFLIAVIGYTVASTLFFGALLRKTASSSLRVARGALFAAGVAHAGLILWSTFIAQNDPVGSMQFAVSAAGWVMTAGFLWAEPRYQVQALGALTGPIALALLVLAQFLSTPAWAPPISRFWLALHVTANLLGVGLFLLAGVASAFYLYVERSLKLKNPALLPAGMPALDSLDLLAFRFLIFGYPFLTFGIVTGGIFFSELGNAGSASLGRAVLGYISWLFLGTVLVWRGALGHRGKKSAFGTLAGVFCVLLLLASYLVRSAEDEPAEHATFEKDQGSWSA